VLVDPDTKSPRWKSEPIMRRLTACRVMLYLHGFLTEAENRKVDGRIKKLVGARITVRAGSGTRKIRPLPAGSRPAREVRFRPGRTE
jgi:hypothetical protein